MGVAHICSLLIAIIAHAHTPAVSQCAWYFVAYAFDTTVGVLLTLGLHQFILYKARQRSDPPGFDLVPDTGTAQHAQHQGSKHHEAWYDAIANCGKYGTPPDLRRWSLQTLEWTACVALARLLCGVFVVGLGSVLQMVAKVLDSVFAGHPALLLFFVMVCCPLLLNAAQLLIQDTVLKGHGESSVVEEVPLQPNPWHH